MLALLLLATGASALEPDTQLLNRPDATTQIRLSGEVGFLGVLAHTIEIGENASRIDYVAEGGQDNLFSFARIEAEIQHKRHRILFLYQPLDLVSEENARRDLSIDGLTFPEGTPMEYRYRFPYYRASWMMDVSKRDDLEVGLGLSLQIRNARIDFTSLDGTLQRSARNIGPVPILKARIRKDYDRGWYVGYEADGFWAPIKYLNGDNNDVEGAILDTSIRAGREVRGGVELFLNLRYVGGGASGTGDNELSYTNSYTRNWLNTVAVSVGSTLF